MFRLVICYVFVCANGLALTPYSELEFANVTELNAFDTRPLPDYFDWRDHKAVSPVKDQKQCAACWAFSAVANIESALKIYFNQEHTLSEQFLIDCAEQKNPCTESTILKAFAVIVSKLGGVLLESQYPYSGQPNKCKWNGLPAPVPVVGFRRVQADEEVMAQFLYSYGPLSAAINAASMANYNHTHGIDQPTDNDCPPSEMNHAVLIVGYSAWVAKSGERIPYWIIKNSWGSDWGDQGYYYLERGRNACGIASEVSFAVVK